MMECNTRVDTISCATISYSLTSLLCFANKPEWKGNSFGEQT